MWPVAPRARSTPSIVAQSIPFCCAAAFRFAANFGERRSAGGVGSGRGEFSQIVAALAGPSISGFGAGFVFGSSTLRSCVHCACASLRRPLERWALRRVCELDELLVALEEPCADDEDEDEHTSELQSRRDLVCRLLLEKKKRKRKQKKHDN